MLVSNIIASYQLLYNKNIIIADTLIMSHPCPALPVGTKEGWLLPDNQGEGQEVAGVQHTRMQGEVL